MCLKKSVLNECVRRLKMTLPKDKLFEKQMGIAIDFLIHYNTYLILKGKLNGFDKLKLFWTITNNAHVRLMISCWAKLYGSNVEATHWTKLLNDDITKEKYRNELYKSLDIKELEWENYWKAMKSCRDKFIAHTQFDFNDPIPNFGIAYKSIIFYIEWMKRYFIEKGIIYVDDLEEHIEPYLTELRSLLD